MNRLERNKFKAVKWGLENLDGILQIRMYEFEGLAICYNPIESKIYALKFKGPEEVVLYVSGPTEFPAGSEWNADDTGYPACAQLIYLAPVFEWLDIKKAVEYIENAYITA